MDELMPKITALAGKPGIPGGHDMIHNLTVCLTWRPEQRSNESQKRAYELMLPVLKGNDLVTWLQKYADFLKSSRLGKPDEIKKVLDRRYTVQGVTSRKLLECYVADDNYDKGASLIPAIIKEEKNRKPEDLYKDILPFFEKKGLAASKVTKKLYEDYLSILSGDRMAEVMGSYAAFLQKYAMADDAAIAKIRADRYKVPGLSDKKLMALYFSEMNRLDETRYWEYFQKAKDLSKKSPELKNQFWTMLAGTYCPPWNKPPCREDLQKLFGDFPDKDVTGWTIHVMRPTIVNALGPLDYSFTSRMLQKCLETDNPERKRMTYSVLASFHRKFAERIYEAPDPAQLRQAIVFEEKYIAMMDPAKSLERRDIISARKNIADDALKCQDWNLVRKQVELVQQLDPQNDIVKYLGLVAYQNGQWEEAVKILMPFCEKRDRDGRVSESTVRALCALKRFAEADRLVSYMIDTNGWSGKGGQYRQEQTHLKLRIKEQEKAK